MSVCDMCNAPLQSGGQPYSASEIHRAAEAGFRPPLLNDMEKLPATFGPYPQMLYDMWLEDLNRKDAADWLLCPTCVGRIEPYLRPTRGQKAKASIDSDTEIKSRIEQIEAETGEQKAKTSIDSDIYLEYSKGASNWRKAEAHVTRGVEHFQAGNLEVAKAHFERAIELRDEPEHGTHSEPKTLAHLAGLAHYNLGLVYGQMGEYGHARTELEEAIRIGEHESTLTRFSQDARDWLSTVKELQQEAERSSQERKETKASSRPTASRKKRRLF